MNSFLENNGEIRSRYSEIPARGPSQSSPFSFKITTLASFSTWRSFAKTWDVDLMTQFLNTNRRCITNNIPCTYAGEAGERPTDRQTHTHHENVTEGYKRIVKQKCESTCSVTWRTWDPHHLLHGVAVKDGFMSDFTPGTWNGWWWGGHKAGIGHDWFQSGSMCVSTASLEESAAPFAQRLIRVNYNFPGMEQNTEQ